MSPSYMMGRKPEKMDSRSRVINCWDKKKEKKKVKCQIQKNYKNKISVKV